MLNNSDEDDPLHRDKENNGKSHKKKAEEQLKLVVFCSVGSLTGLIDRHYKHTQTHTTWYAECLNKYVGYGFTPLAKTEMMHSARPYASCRVQFYTTLP